MAVVRSLVIALLMLLAIVFLALGVQVPIPDLPLRGVALRDIPIGIVFVLAGIAVARFWTIPQDEGKLVEEFQRSRKRHGPANRH